jgi:hypothetical protein
MLIERVWNAKDGTDAAICEIGEERDSGVRGVESQDFWGQITRVDQSKITCALRNMNFER